MISISNLYEPRHQETVCMSTVIMHWISYLTPEKPSVDSAAWKDRSTENVKLTLYILVVPLRSLQYLTK